MDFHETPDLRKKMKFLRKKKYAVEGFSMCVYIGEGFIMRLYASPTVLYW